MLPALSDAPWTVLPGVAVPPFGALVTLGVLLGMVYVHWQRERTGLDARELSLLIIWSVGPGFLLAHVASALVYYPDAVRADPWLPLRMSSGMSSYGGFLGAFLGGAVYLRLVNRKPFLPAADVLTEGLVLGWLFGRIGCTIAFDHPGRPSTFALAFDHPVLGARHNLGFYEVLFTAFVLLPAVYLLARRPRAPGTSVAWLALLYAPARFGLDFLRSVDLAASDLRYLGLTPAQWVCLPVIAIAIGMLRRRGWFACRRGPMITRND